jgi:Kef-type K+ transport system membrane component KefB
MVVALVGADRERALREEVREELRRVMDVDALAEPGPAEVEQVRRVIADRIEGFNRRVASLGEPPLGDAAGLARRILDDILGLVTLSVIIGLATAGTVSWLEAGRTAGFASLFLVLAIAAGIRYAHLFSRLVNRMSTRGGLLIAALSFALLPGYVTGWMGLAALVGAFAAGLILARSEHRTHIETTIKPVADVFVPIFFVLIGAAVNLHDLNPLDSRNWPVLLLAGGLTLVAVIGKLVAGLGVTGAQANRWAIGVGMLPRGEVGLIFASLGLTYRILDEAQYGAILLVVVLTTLVSPILLKRAFKGS